MICLGVAPRAPSERANTHIKLHKLTISPSENVSGRKEVTHVGAKVVVDV